MNGRIAFVDLEGRAVTCAPDGSDCRSLSGSRRIFQFPSWSHDGRYIAAIGSNENGGGLYVFADGERAPFVEPEYYISHQAPPFYHAWSPHAYTLLFLTPHEGQRYGLRGGALTAQPQLLTTGNPFFWSWTDKTGELLAHVGENAPEARLAVFDVLKKQWAENIAAPGRFQAPGVSADGRFCAYAGRNLDGGSRLVVERRGNGEQMQLPHYGIIRLVWSPTRPYLAFISPRGDDTPYGPLLLLDAETGTAWQLSNEAVLAFFWAPNGRSLAYLTLADRERSVARQNGAYTNGHGGQMADLSTVTQSRQFKLFVVDLQTRHARVLMTFTPPPTFLNQYLPFFDQYAHSHRMWSPDSAAMVWPALTAESAEIRCVPLDGRPPHAIAAGLMPCWSPSL